MNKFTKALFVTLTALSYITHGMEVTDKKATTTPLTPRTTAFQQFLGDVVKEKFDQEFKQSPSSTWRVLKVKNPANDDLFIGLFPEGTKTSEAIAFIDNYLTNPAEFVVKDGSTAKLMEGEEQSEKSLVQNDLNKFYKIVSDKENTRHLLAHVTIPTEKAPETCKSSEQVTPQPTNFELELKRFESWVQREARPAIEQAGRSTGKALEKAGQQTGDALEKAGQQTANFTEKAASQVQRESTKVVKKLFGKK